MRILIIGGFGFIGKNLYYVLKNKNYDVDILTDRLLESSDPFNNHIDKKNVIVGDILDKKVLQKIIPKYSIIYSFAALSGAKESNENPFINNKVNCIGHLNILETCKKYNPDVLIFFPSSRLVYGKPDYLPVDEQHKLNPDSIYAIHKMATEYYYQLYYKLYKLKSIILRISNPYGPFQENKTHTYGLLNWFIHQAKGQNAIKLFGGGRQRRDYIFIKDLIDLFIYLQNRHDLAGKVFNVGSGEGISIYDSVVTIQNFMPHLNFLKIEWPDAHKKIETGDFITDITKIKSNTEWEPKTKFADGIEKTVEYYTKNKIYI